ncbi:hypothetical protein [Kitasatospora sp. McL0602]|uniref:hypothetical protein n=1 Tax=Kitasatospora sp. McL0602 TaxID=3439530 RepID=UPI003F88A5EA
MSNRNKSKGTAHETAVMRFLNTELGLGEWQEWQKRFVFADPHNPDNIKRQVQTGKDDVGDLHARPFVVECKDEQTIRLPEYVRQANREAANAGFPYGVAVVKARRRKIQDAYAVTDLGTFARILRALRENTTEAGESCANARDSGPP